MTIAHKNIPEDGLHEPKGVSTAASKRVYVADGNGSGVWSRLDAESLDGSITTGTPAGQRVVTDGAGGFDSEETPASSYATMNLTDNATVKAVTAAVDGTLNTNSDFQEIDLAFSFDSVQNFTTGSNFLQVNQTGLYLINFWSIIASDTPSTRWALKFFVNGASGVARSPKVWLDSSNEFYNASANGIHSFTAGDQVKLYMACNKSVNITLEDLNFQMVLLEGL